MAKISLIYPDSWLTISISIRNRDSWVEEFNWTMTEVGTTKVYKYDFTEVANTDYVYVSSCTWYDSMSGVVYMDTTQWLTIEEHTHLMQLVNSTWGGGFSSQAIQTSISNAKKAIMDRIDEIKPTDLTEIETKLNENYSHITLATDDILIVQKIIRDAYIAVGCIGYSRIDCFFQTDRFGRTRVYFQLK